MPRSTHGGRHELGQNFLHHRPTIRRLKDLIADTTGPILELGAGDGALTEELATLGRPVTAIDIDEHRVRRLRRRLPAVHVQHADALRYPLTAPNLVGNIPFHLTTPILRRMLDAPAWHHAVLLTQWEVARKRAGVGGHTMMTAQAAPWFEFQLHGRVPAYAFTPAPSVDGGILSITRRSSPLVPNSDRKAYEGFIRSVFTGSGRSLPRILERAAGIGHTSAKKLLGRAGVPHRSLPRDITPQQWAALWGALKDPHQSAG